MWLELWPSQVPITVMNKCLCRYPLGLGLGPRHVPVMVRIRGLGPRQIPVSVMIRQ